jgi:hypothetical protein
MSQRARVIPKLVFRKVPRVRVVLIDPKSTIVELAARVIHPFRLANNFDPVSRSRFNVTENVRSGSGAEDSGPVTAVPLSGVEQTLKLEMSD